MKELVFMGRGKKSSGEEERRALGKRKGEVQGGGKERSGEEIGTATMDISSSICVVLQNLAKVKEVEDMQSSEQWPTLSNEERRAVSVGRGRKWRGGRGWG